MWETTRGRVLFYDEEKGCGVMYVLDEDGQETDKRLNFYWKDGYWTGIRAGAVHWTDSFLVNCPPNIPRVMQDLVFTILVTDGVRDKAARWAFLEQYDACQHAFEHQKYRVLRITGDLTNLSKVESTAIWNGEGVRKLMERFPIRRQSNEVVDPLLRVKLEDNGLAVSYRLEIEQDGTWQLCSGPNDPRLNIRPSVIID